MDKIIYSENTPKAELKKLNIVIENSSIADGVEIEPNVSIVNSKIEDGAKIGSFCVLKECVIESGAEILSSRIENSRIGKFSHVGPFAHIRQNSVVGENNRIGNFVELKNAKTQKDCKMAHLTYVGDAEMGENCNIGCGVVFCNYNGKIKQKSILGNNVFVGSNVNLVAPVLIGDDAYIAAGSTICQNVETGQFAIARSRQTNKDNFKNPYIDKK